VVVRTQRFRSFEGRNRWPRERTFVCYGRLSLLTLELQSGKSTIVNLLSGSDVVPVYQSNKGGSGFSTSKYPSRVDMKLEDLSVQLLDTPGVMRHRPASGSASSEELEAIRVRDILYRNRGQVHRLHDPLPPGLYPSFRYRLQAHSNQLNIYSLNQLSKI
jgi:hypothetical protein